MQAHQVVCGVLIRCFWGCWERFPFLFFVRIAPGVQLWIWTRLCVEVAWGRLFFAQTGRGSRSSCFGCSGSLRPGGGRRTEEAGRVCGGSGRCDVAPGLGAPCVLLGKLSLDHGSLAVAGCAGSREGRCGEWAVLAHRLLGGGSSGLSVSCPSLGSGLIAAARARLWSSFKRRSESPHLARHEAKRQEKVSCLFGSCRPFPGLPPG